MICDSVEFFVAGRPSPGGSKSAFFIPRLGRSVLVDAGGAKTKRWREAVRFAAIDAMDGQPPLKGPLVLQVAFQMDRPAKHHVGNDRDRPLRDDAPWWHTIAPDATKLMRSTEDAMKGVVWIDDSRVCLQSASKRYAPPGEPAGARIRVSVAGPNALVVLRNAAFPLELQ